MVCLSGSALSVSVPESHILWVHAFVLTNISHFQRCLACPALHRMHASPMTGRNLHGQVIWWLKSSSAARLLQTSSVMESSMACNYRALSPEPFDPRDEDRPHRIRNRPARCRSQFDSTQRTAAWVLQGLLLHRFSARISFEAFVLRTVGQIHRRALQNHHRVLIRGYPWQHGRSTKAKLGS